MWHPQKLRVKLCSLIKIKTKKSMVFHSGELLTAVQNFILKISSFVVLTSIFDGETVQINR